MVQDLLHCVAVNLLVRMPEQALRAQVRPKPGRAVLMDQDLLHRVLPIVLTPTPKQALRAQVRPKPGRAVLMDQDLLHRVSAPSPAAGGRPRYSLGPPSWGCMVQAWVV